ncbi:MAG: sulfite exporter TauE/SafE family protein [Gemmatimonadales bacterium]
MVFYVAVFGAGLAAGFLNVLAGGGSLLILPILIFLGLPVAVANGTNRFAILVQNVAAVASFRQQGLRHARGGLGLALATIPGAVLGAVLAVRVDPGIFRAILAAVLILAVVGLLLPGPEGDGHRELSPRARVVAFLGFLAIGFYGGFIQAGVGLLLMLVLHRLLHFDLLRTNVHKVFVVLVVTLPALAVFIATGNVSWGTAASLAAGNATGAVAATRVSVKGGDRPIRIALAIALALMAVKLVV